MYDNIKDVPEGYFIFSKVGDPLGETGVRGYLKDIKHGLVWTLQVLKYI